MEDILLFSNILDNAKPPRKYREWLLTIDELTDKELRTRYRTGRQSIEIITDLIREEILHPTQRSHSLSAETQVRKFFFTLLNDTCTSIRCEEFLMTAHFTSVNWNICYEIMNKLCILSSVDLLFLLQWFKILPWQLLFTQINSLL